MKKYLMIMLLFINSLLYAVETTIDFKYIGIWQLLGISESGSEIYQNGDMRNMVVIDMNEIMVIGVDDSPRKIKSIITKRDLQGIKITTIIMENCRFYYIIQDTSENSIMFKMMIVENNKEQLRFILGK